MLGYIADEAVIVTDVIESPDFGTSHSVAVSDMGYYHIEAILKQNLKMGITATKVGIYHSHPKMGVFMSVVDVGQNRSGQKESEHVSIVIDPIESVKYGRLEIGAFRIYVVSQQLPWNGEGEKMFSTPPPPPKEEATDTFGVDPLEEMQGNGLGLGGMKVFRHGHQSSSIGDPNPHGEGLSFFKGSNRGGGYYRMKMSICASAFESDACAQMVPDVWMTPLLASPLIDSSMLAVKSTELSASGIFDHSNSLIGSESDMTRVCSQCASVVSLQERCIVVDQTKAALFQKPE